MSIQNTEPVYIDVKEGIMQKEQLILEIRDLLEEERFAALSTYGKEGPDTSLISFAASEDLMRIIFATPKETGKYFNIEKNGAVSMLIDDRCSHPDNINAIRTLSITGTARIISNEEEKSKWGDVLVRKHPMLEKFVAAESTALILAEVKKYLFVTRFQEVFVWVPSGDRRY